jgi:protein TonB
MLGTRSLIGLTLSLLVHAGAVAFFVTQDVKKEKPKPKKITLQMAMFQSVVVKSVPTRSVPTKSVPTKNIPPVIKKTVKAKPKKIVTPPPKPALVVPNKPKPVAKVKPVIKKKQKPKKRIVKKKKKIKKVTIRKPIRKVVKKPPIKPRRVIPKKKVVVRKPRPVVRRAPSPVYRKPPIRRAVPVRPKRAPIAKKPPQRVIKPVTKVKPAKPQQGNPRLEKQYGIGIHGLIKQKKSYPRRAKRRKIQGVVKVAFNIAKNGLISNLRIHQSSGSSLLDKAALDTVRKVGRFPAIPSTLNKQVLSYIIPISYKLR